MKSLIALIASAAAVAVLFTGSIAFNLTTTVTWYDALNLITSSIALECFGAVIFPVLIADYAVRGAKPVHLPIFALGFGLYVFSAIGYQFYETQSDARLANESTASQTNTLKLQIAQAITKQSSGVNVDTQAATAQLVAMEKEAAKCKHVWSWGCKSKARAGSDDIRMQIEAKNKATDAMKEALTAVRETEQGDWKKAPDYAKKFASLFLGSEEMALDAQSMWRWVKAFFIATVAFFGGVVVTLADDKRRKKVSDFIRHAEESLTPAPHSQHHSEQRIWQRPTTAQSQNEIVAARPSAEDYELNPAFLDNRNEPRPPLSETGKYKFVDTDGLPKQSTASTIKKPVNRARLNTDERALISTGSIASIDKKASSGGTGRGVDDLEPVYRVLVDSIKDKSFYKSENTVGVNSIKRACKLGTPKAQVLMTMLIERGVDLSK